MTDVTKLHEVVARGQRILVVGAKSGNLPKQFETHPALLIWSSQQGRFPPIPKDVGGVLFTRWLGHAPQQELVKEGRARGLAMSMRLHSSGELRRILSKLHLPEGQPMQTHTPTPAPVQPTPPPAPAAPQRKVKTGNVWSYLRTLNINPDVKPSLEVERVMTRALMDGVDVRRQQVFTFITNLRIKQKKDAQAAKAAKAAAREAKAATPVVKPEPMVGPSSDIRDILALLDEAQTSITLVREALKTFDPKAQLTKLLEKL